MDRQIRLVLRVEDQPRIRELVAMWMDAQVNTTLEVFHPISSIQKMGEIEIVEVLECELEERPTHA